MRRSSYANTTALAALSLGLVACSSGTTTTATPSSSPTSTKVSSSTSSSTAPRSRSVAPGRSRLGLEPVDGCDELLARLRSLATDHVTAWGLDVPGPYRLAMDDAGMRTAAGVAAPPANAPAAGAAEQSSGTNTQEAGVDEGDQVENDGRYVFSVLDGRLRIVDTTTGEQASTELPGNGGQHQLVLDGPRLVVVSGAWNASRFTDVAMPMYGYGSTVVTVYDVTKPLKPTVTQRRQLEGSALAVRAANGTVRVVLSSTLGARIPFVQPAQPGEVVENKAKAINLDAVKNATVDDWLPRIGEPSADGSAAVQQGERALACDKLSVPTVDSGLGLTWIASIDTNGSVSGSAGVVAAGGTTYATGDRLYVTTTQWSPVGSDPDVKPARPADPETAIHRFALAAGGAAAYEGTGIVPGTLLNSYAMSERADALRVATTVDHPDGSAPSSSGIHVLRLGDGVLNEVGTVTGLGKGERIFAVRYVGDYGYVVTFRRTDPLYVVDLRNDTKPAVAGELKIPGYSAYLHPLDDGRLLGVGQNATNDGRVLGLQVSLFDVRDPQAPARLANLEVGGASEAEWDPHAFLWWAPTGVAYVPLQPWWGNEKSAPLSGLAAVRLTGDRLTLGGTLLPPGASADAPNQRNANTGISPMEAPVQRAMIVGGKLVAVSMLGVRIAEPASLAVSRDILWT